MIVVETSAWVEFLRGTRSGAATSVRRLITSHASEIVVAEPTMLELLCGPTDEGEVRRVRRLLHQFEIAPIAPGIDTELAAEVARACRRAGRTVRSVVDCLIAAIAIRLGAPVLHRDRDFDVMARHSLLQIV